MNRRERKILERFVDGLTESEAREELLRAYCQMEHCLDLLNGEDVEPIEMKDNGLSSDLELFYTIKKKMLESRGIGYERRGNCEEFCMKVENDTITAGKVFITDATLNIPVRIIEKR